MTHLVTLAATGWFAGWAVRKAMRRRYAGLVADGVIGLVGAMIGGWLFRALGIVTPGDALAHVVVALVGAAVLVVALSVARSTWSAAAPAAHSVMPAVSDLEAHLHRLGDVERRVADAFIRRLPTAADANRHVDAQATFGERVADRVASFGGSWTFIGLFLVVMIAWMTLNDEMTRPFDPYPFILLNLVLSCVAALQAPVIMMSQNRQGARDRLEAHHDYEVNLRAELEVMSLHNKLDMLRAEELQVLSDEMRRQAEALSRVQVVLERLASAAGARADGPGDHA